MKVNYTPTEEPKQLYIADLNTGDIFKTCVYGESTYIYMKTCTVCCRGAELNAVCLDDGTLLEVAATTQVIPYEGELDIKRKY